MSDQLLLSGLRATLTKSYVVVRGDTKEIVFLHDLGASGNIKEARFEMENASGTAVMQLTWADHPDCFDFTVSGIGRVLLQDPDVEESWTSAFDPASYAFAVEVIDQVDRVYTPIKGFIDLQHGIVDDDSTAAYLSWATLETYNTAWNGFLGEIYGGIVSADAASGDGTIDVDGASDLFAAADNIWVQLGNPGGVTGETHAVDSVSGDTITLDGTTLGADVAAGNVVRKKE